MRSRYIIVATLSKEFALIARPHVVGTLIWAEKLNSLVFPSIPDSHLLPEWVLGFLRVLKSRISDPDYGAILNGKVRGFQVDDGNLENGYYITVHT